MNNLSTIRPFVFLRSSKRSQMDCQHTGRYVMRGQDLVALCDAADTVCVTPKTD